MHQWSRTGALFQGLKKNGTIIINGKRSPEFYRKIIGNDFRTLYRGCLARGGREQTGRSFPIPLSIRPYWALFPKATGLVKIESVEHAIMEYAPIKPEENKRAARAVYNLVITG